MMTQYNETVNNQRLLLEAEEWAKGIKSIHAHSTSSMWYDTRPQDTEEGKSVVDLPSSVSCGLVSYHIELVE